MTDSEKLDFLIAKSLETDKRFEEINQHFERIDQRFERIDQRLDGIDQRLDGHDQKFEGIDQKFEGIDQKLEKMETNITEIKLTLENEIRTNIKRVAEGHLDLSRQFEKTVKLDNEKEMLAIRVSILETEMRRMQQRLNQMAG